MPVAFPLTVFERGWVLSWLIRVSIPVCAPPEMVLSLTAPLRAEGTPAADGLPCDADTTAGTLYALALLGVPHRPDALWNYETSEHFCTWQGEDGFSTTTNAHVLEAFGEFVETGFADRAGADAARRYAATVDKVAGWLRGQQRDDGSWTDRWHASPVLRDGVLRDRAGPVRRPRRRERTPRTAPGSGSWRPSARTARGAAGRGRRRRRRTPSRHSS